MGYFPVRFDSRVVIYECKMFIRLATGYFYKVNNYVVVLPTYTFLSRGRYQIMSLLLCVQGE